MYDILYYDGGNIEKRELVKTVLEEAELNYCMLDANDLAQSIGYLMKLDGFEAIETTSSVNMNIDLMILRDHMDDETIMKLSSNLRDNFAHVERKAMLTQHNRDWTLAALLQEIEEEHHYFVKSDELKAYLMEMNQLSEADYTPDTWKSYEHALVQGYMLLQEQPKIELLETMLEMIKEAKNNLKTV